MTHPDRIALPVERALLFLPRCHPPARQEPPTVHTPHSHTVYRPFPNRGQRRPCPSARGQPRSVLTGRTLQGPKQMTTRLFCRLDTVGPAVADCSRACSTQPGSFSR